MTWSSRFLIFCLVLYIWGVQGDPPPKIQCTLVAQNLNKISKIGRTTSLALITKSTPVIFCDNRMYSQGARAASVLSTQSCFSTFEKQYQVSNGLDGLKVPLLVYTNHINHKKHVDHGFLAPRPYLCSTSLKIAIFSWHVRRKNKNKSRKPAFFLVGDNLYMSEDF